MSTSADRRATGVNRVPVETVVEICGRDAQVPAFEADAVELSGRGMQVRTEYLPELNAPLVLRFEDRGREVVVEGEVAWRREGENSGEFGIRFTALDSNSVEVLRDLCAAQGPVLVESAPQKPPVQAPTVQAPSEAIKAEPHSGAPGSPVKLHIEGLNAPMKARVRGTNGRRMQVGSNLEFLRVGRSIEVEDVDQGERRDAKIDSVTVAIDPQTQVPQLVVALRYAGEITPEPSVVDAEDDELQMQEQEARPDWDDLDGDPGISDHYRKSTLGHDAEALGAESAGERFKERLVGAATQMSVLARRGGASVGELSTTVGGSLGRLAQGLGHQIAEFRARRSAQGSKRRTAGAPSAPNAEGRRIKLQPQHRSHPPVAQQGRKTEGLSAGVTSAGKRPVRIIAGAALLVVGTVGATLAFSKGDEKSAKKEQAKAAAAMEQETQLQQAAPATDQAPAAALNAQGTGDQAGIVADVPLFGPTTLATAQPEPLGVVQADIAYEDQAPDQAFEEAPTAEKAPAKSSDVKPDEVKPWGKGRLHLPTVHRLRLDAPGAALKGFTKTTGFSILIPKRKVLDNPKVIVKRDDRIAGVTADTTPEGAVVTFRFRGPVPTHKVRLRNDYVEFFISAPGGSN